MNKNDFVNGILELELAYNNFMISDNTKRVNYWYQYFANVDGATFITGVREYIRTSVYAPTIANLFDSMKGAISLSNDSQMIEEWELINKLLFSKNLNETQTMEYLGANSIAFQALEHTGFKRLKKSNTNELPFIFNDFKEIYKELAENKFNYDLKNGNLSIGQDNNNLIGIE